MPVLEVDGKQMLAQSNAIARYLAKEFRKQSHLNSKKFRADHGIVTRSPHNRAKSVQPRVRRQKGSVKRRELKLLFAFKFRFL